MDVGLIRDCFKVGDNDFWVGAITGVIAVGGLLALFGIVGKLPPEACYLADYELKTGEEVCYCEQVLSEGCVLKDPNVQGLNWGLMRVINNQSSTYDYLALSYYYPITRDERFNMSIIRLLEVYASDPPRAVVEGGPELLLHEDVRLVAEEK